MMYENMAERAHVDQETLVYDIRSVSVILFHLYICVAVSFCQFSIIVLIAFIRNVFLKGLAHFKGSKVLVE